MNARKTRRIGDAMLLGMALLVAAGCASDGGSPLDIIGYTDATGGSMANNQLSWRREEVVRRYLTDNAALLNRISFIGLGEEKAGGPKKDAEDRHVSIAIYRPAD